MHLELFDSIVLLDKQFGLATFAGTTASTGTPAAGQQLPNTPRPWPDYCS